MSQNSQTPIQNELVEALPLINLLLKYNANGAVMQFDGKNLTNEHDPRRPETCVLVERLLRSLSSDPAAVTCYSADNTGIVTIMALKPDRLNELFGNRPVEDSAPQATA